MSGDLDRLHFEQAAMEKAMTTKAMDRGDYLDTMADVMLATMRDRWPGIKPDVISNVAAHLAYRESREADDRFWTGLGVEESALDRDYGDAIPF